MASTATVCVVAIGGVLRAALAYFMSISQPPPGFYIAVLGVLAVLLTVRLEKGHIRPMERIAWVVVAFALFFMEVHILYSDREKHEKDAADDRKLQADRFDATIARFAELQKVMAASNHSKVIVERVVAQPVPNAEEQDARKRAAQLSSEILAFLRDRQLNDPAFNFQMLADNSTLESRRENAEKIGRYMSETMSIYSHDYASRVIAVRNDLGRYGIQSNRLDQLYENPVNPPGLRMLAEVLGGLALQRK